MEPIVKSYRYTKCCSVVYYNRMLNWGKMLAHCSTGPASRSTKDSKTFSAPYPVILHISSLRLPASAIRPLECIQNASA